MKSTEVVNTKTLLRHLFDVAKKLNAGAITGEEAMAQANLVKQANNLLKYELDRARQISKIGNTLRDIEESETEQE